MFYKMKPMTTVNVSFKVENLRLSRKNFAC